LYPSLLSLYLEVIIFYQLDVLCLVDRHR
jgi:hypothetical protein